MIATIMIIIVVFVIISCITGTLTQNLHNEKGYNGGFWLGFFFGGLGLLYAVGLPDRTDKIIEKTTTITTINNNNDEKYLGEHYIRCQKCGNQIFDDENSCSNCGEKIKR